MCKDCFKCYQMPSTATGNLSNAPIKVVKSFGGTVYLQLNLSPTDAILSDTAKIAEIEAYLATSPTVYDCDTLAQSVEYKLDIAGLTDEKVTFSFTAPDGTVTTTVINFATFLKANEILSSDGSILIIPAADTNDPNGTDDKQLDVKVNTISVKDYICLDLGNDKKAFGYVDYNVWFADTTKSPIAGSKLFTILETSDAAVLAKGVYVEADITMPFITLNSDACLPCDCLDYVF